MHSKQLFLLSWSSWVISVAMSSVVLKPGFLPSMMRKCLMSLRFFMVINAGQMISFIIEFGKLIYFKCAPNICIWALKLFCMALNLNGCFQTDLSIMEFLFILVFIKLNFYANRVYKCLRAWLLFKLSLDLFLNVCTWADRGHVQSVQLSIPPMPWR